MPEKQLRCGDCKLCWEGIYRWLCWPPNQRIKKVNPGQYAGKCFVYKDK